MSGGGAGWDYNVGAAGGVTDNRVPNNKFTNNTVSWSAGRDVAPGVTLRTIGRVEYGKVGTPGQTAFGRPDMDASYEHRDAVAGRGGRSDNLPRLGNAARAPRRRAGQRRGDQR